MEGGGKAKLVASWLGLSLLVVFAVLPGPAPAASAAEAIQLVQTPTEVHSYQPVFIFARVTGGRVVVRLRATLETRVSAQPLSPGDLGLSIPAKVTVDALMIPVPWAAGWFVAALPPLPTLTYRIRASPPPSPTPPPPLPPPPTPSPVDVTIKVTGAVSYEVLLDRASQAKGSYTVQEGEVSQELPPVVYATPIETLEKLTVSEETFGLGPGGWVWPGGSSFGAGFIAMDDKGLPGIADLKFEYRVGTGNWTEGAFIEHPLSMPLGEATAAVNHGLGSLEAGLRRHDSTIAVRRVPVPFFVGRAEVGQQPAGTFVQFRGRAVDVDGNRSLSPAGLYYTVNQGTDKRLLILDPHVRSWVVQEALRELAATAQANSRYRFPAEVVRGLSAATRLGELGEKYRLVPFHHWEILGVDYNFRIATPRGGVKDILASFKPQTVFLSNLFLGVEGADLANWDLKDAGVQEDLIKYVKENHAGVIASHGTLSDWKVWPSKEEQKKVGTRGHVGEKMPEDLSPLEEKSVAALLGVPHLSLFEYVRDQVAKALDSPYGEVAGSIPLQVPFVPFSGSLLVTPDGRGHPLLGGLGESFVVPLPGIHEELGFKATTQIGWQLALPQAVAYTAWRKAKEVQPRAQELADRMAGMAQESTEGRLASGRESARVGEALQWGLDRFYTSLASAQISPEALRIALDIPGQERIDRTLPLDWRRLLALVPVKLVALSDDGLAGVVAHDKYYVKDGYRAVYFSMEVEAGSQPVHRQVLANAIEWARGWQYVDLLEFFGKEGVALTRKAAQVLRSETEKAGGQALLSQGLLLNERGTSLLSLAVPGPGRLTALVAHPTSDQVEVQVVEGEAQVLARAPVGERVTRVEMQVAGKGTVKLGIIARSESSLNPAYAEASYSPAPTPTPTPTPTPAPTPTPTPTPTPAPTPTPTPAPALTPAATPAEVLPLTPTATPAATPAPTPTPTPPRERKGAACGFSRAGMASGASYSGDLILVALLFGGLAALRLRKGK